MEIAKEYLPGKVERRWIEAWEASGAFRAHPESGAEPFCMVIPPPNVTGNLHIGHVLVYTLHDVVARWHRMRGRDVLWLPGTDHAGIATQMVVERQMRAEEGKTRHDLGREAFEARVWEWKERYGGRIISALRNLGASCDWSRERFTLDDGLSRAVRAVFVRLYQKGLIYRDRYIVHWCPRCHTALSDLETVHQPVAGKLYRVRYPFADGEAGLVVATTRPETMFGDTAVAVHPEDERYTGAVGLSVALPLTDRTIPVVADAFVDRAFGTGAVKITPAHDPNDFEAGKRNALEQVVAIDTSGVMTDAAGQFAGLDRFEARKAVVAALRDSGALLDVTDHEHAVGHCQRCHTMVEPMVSTQWFVRVADLAAPAIEAVEKGRTEFVPASWAKTYFEWMRNIHDWCISRQLWWGHRIPAWYCDPCGTVIVSEADPEACNACGGSLRRDEDVLDTWFSSALWPFSTMGWPERTDDLERYYPTDLLITGFDIIFFWVARMMMMGLEFQDDVPFRKVYIHGLVRDARGQKMSKSKGNTIDPAEVQERYGTDAVRFTMSMLAAPGNDIPLAPERMEGYRAFANKLWNASRFVLMKLDGVSMEAGDALADGELSVVDRWILSGATRVVRRVDEALEAFRFDLAADALYHFTWTEYCSWYIELVKPDLQDGADPGRARTARTVLRRVLSELLALLHPMMPFVTEELWEKLPGADGLLATSAWPSFDDSRLDEEAEREVDVLKKIVETVRNLRAEARIDPARKVRVVVRPADAATERIVTSEAHRIATLVRAEGVEVAPTIEGLGIAVRGVAVGSDIALPLEGVIDVEAERGRLGREIAKIAVDIDKRGKKLENPKFVDRAPADVVAKERALHDELVEKRAKLRASLEALSGEGPSE